MEVLAFLVVSQSVEEPSWDSLSFRVGDDVCYFIALLLVELSSSDARVDSKDLADQETESPTNSLDLFQSIRNSPLPVNVSIEDTMNVLEVCFCVFDNQ